MTTPKAFLHALGGPVFFTLWNENISCHINKQKCHSHQRYLASNCEWGLPKLRSRGCSHTPPPHSSDGRGCCHSPHSSGDCWGVGRKQGEQGNRTGPDSWSAWEKNECSEPRGLHLPIHRMLNSLTGYLIFAVQTACSLFCKLVYSDSPSCLFGAVLLELLRCCLSALEL